MAVINKTGITNGGTVQAEHVTRAIDALSGVSTDTIIATGSFTGSLTGILTGTGSYATRALSSSFATTASYVANASSFPFTGSAQITGSLGVTGSLRITGSLGVTGSLGLNGPLSGSITGSSTLIVNLGTVGSSGNFIIPFNAPSSPVRGSMYFDASTSTLYIHNGSVWRNVSLGA